MRPIKLEMKAFGAYVKPTTIDFEHGLGEERIFLINGQEPINWQIPNVEDKTCDQ